MKGDMWGSMPNMTLLVKKFITPHTILVAACDKFQILTERKGVKI